MNSTIRNLQHCYSFLNSYILYLFTGKYFLGYFEAKLFRIERSHMWPIAMCLLLNKESCDLRAKRSKVKVTKVKLWISSLDNIMAYKNKYKPDQVSRSKVNCVSLLYLAKLLRIEQRNMWHGCNSMEVIYQDGTNIIACN